MLQKMVSLIENFKFSNTFPPQKKEYTLEN